MTLGYELRRRGGGIGVCGICFGHAQGDAMLIRVTSKGNREETIRFSIHIDIPEKAGRPEKRRGPGPAVSPGLPHSREKQGGKKDTIRQSA